MSDPDQDRAFEDYLARRSGIRPHATQSDGLEPPAELDRLVLARAREAIAIRKPPALFRSARWAVPVSVAATVVLSVAVVLHMGLLSPPAQRQPAGATSVSDSALAKEEAASPAAREMMAPAPSADAAQARKAEAPANEEPAAWLKRIETLRAQGKTREAALELEAFRRAWPDFPIPETAHP